MWTGERESKSAGKEGRKDGKDGWKRERGDERVGGGEVKKSKAEIGKEEVGDWKRGRRRGKKSKTGIGKEEEQVGHRVAYSLKQEGTICLQFCCVISKKAVGTE